MTTGLTVGPARQMVMPGDNAYVYVSNPGTTTIHVHGVGNGAALDPSTFTLHSGEQVTVQAFTHFGLEGCRFLSPAFYVVQREAGQTVAARGGVAAQILVQGRSGSEADCVATIPQPAVIPTTAVTGGPPFAEYGVAIALLVAVGLGLVRGVHYCGRKPRGRHIPGMRPRRASGF